jgi:hypothetical protein
MRGNGEHEEATAMPTNAYDEDEFYIGSFLPHVMTVTHNIGSAFLFLKLEERVHDLVLVALEVLATVAVG